MRRVGSVAGAVLVALGAASAAGPVAEARGPAAPYVVVYAAGVDAPARATEARERRDGFRARLRFGAAVGGFAATLTPAQAARLAADPAVRAVSPDRAVEAVAAAPSLAPGETAPPGVRRVGAATASTSSPASTSGIAVLDTGVDLDHPDLVVRGGRNCVASGAPPDDDNGHGTHVAGTIAARNAGRDVVGVAPGTPIWAVKALDAAGRGSWSQVICGLDWAAGTRTDADPANDIDVVNLSLSGGGDVSDARGCAAATSALHLAVCRATAAGVTLVVSAGNSGRSFERATTPDVPAAYPEVLTVTAMTDTDGAAGGAGPSIGCAGVQHDDRYGTYSNFATSPAGAAHVIAAPGSCVVSTARGGGTASRTGTSMAAPHVAGLAALCLGTVSDGPGPCAGQTPAQVAGTLRAAAAARSAAAPTSGFLGDPTRPTAGRTYGHLAWAGTGAGGGGDTAVPTVQAFAPADGATGVAPGTTVAVTFSEPMDQAATASAFSLTGPGGAIVAGARSWSGTTLTFTPAARLNEGAAYVARVSTGARDVAGNALATARAAGFTVATAAPSAALAPSALAVGTGTNPRGGVAELAAADGSAFVLDSSSGVTTAVAWTATFTAVPAGAATLNVAYTAAATRPCTRELTLQRVRDGAWIAVGAGLPAADFRTAAGEVRVRVRCTASLRTFTASADRLALTVGGGAP